MIKVLDFHYTNDKPSNTHTKHIIIELYSFQSKLFHFIYRINFSIFIIGKLFLYMKFDFFALKSVRDFI